MENATKALLMAGGILIAIIIISLLVRTYGNIGAFQKQQLTAEEAKQIEEYNKDYTKYDGQYVYGTEVITVVNRSLNYEQKYNFDIHVVINFKKDYNYMNKNIMKLDLKDENAKYTFIDFTINSKNKDYSEDLKSRAFKCEKITYGEDGRVNYIEFTERQFN